MRGWEGEDDRFVTSLARVKLSTTRVANLLCHLSEMASEFFQYTHHGACPASRVIARSRHVRGSGFQSVAVSCTLITTYPRPRLNAGDISYRTDLPSSPPSSPSLALAQQRLIMIAKAIRKRGSRKGPIEAEESKCTRLAVHEQKNEVSWMRSPKRDD